MKKVEILSEAFARAALRSEQYRVAGLLITLGLLLVVMIVRMSIFGSEAEVEILPRFLLLMVSMIGYEAAMFLVLRRINQKETSLPGWTWSLNVFVESLFPTLALLILTTSRFMGPYRALVAPAALIYFYFIILSTLRLKPYLSQLTGVFSALGYSAVAIFTYLRYTVSEAGGIGFSSPVYVTYAFIILLGGFIAGAVAGQIRTHVQAALREAETRRQVERMEHDLNIARSIQQGLLPKKCPEIEGFDIAGWNLPADQTGGDYYDWQSLPNGRVAITLADVTGHGIGPALVAALCRAYGRASFPSGSELEERGSGGSKVTCR